MHFKVAETHRTFFRHHGFIEFDLAIPSEEIDSLATLTQEAVQKKASKAVGLCSAEELYNLGHDLWRSSPLLRKKILSHSLAEIAGQLFDKKALLIGFDQLLCTTKTSGFPGQIPAPLQSLSSIQPLAGSVLLHLSGDLISSPFIPTSLQNGLFFSPTLTIPWEIFFQLPHQSYLLIAYALPESLYVHEKRDLHLHSLKKLGYGYGDRLSHEHHPVIYRKG